MQINRVRKAIAEHDLSLGTWVQMNNPDFCDMIGPLGLDFAIVDMEHGSFGLESAVEMFRAIEARGAMPVVRTVDDSPFSILKVLDAGAMAVLVPGITDKVQMERVVRAARYGPTGSRGACPAVRATDHGVREWPEFVPWANQQTMVWALVEGVEGVENFEEIISVAGLDVVAVGPFDLSQAMGLNGQVHHPEVVRRQRELTEKARQAGVEVLTVLFETDEQEMTQALIDWHAIGSRIITVSGDRFLLSSGFKRIMQTVTTSLQR